MNNHYFSIARVGRLMALKALKQQRAEEAADAAIANGRVARFTRKTTNIFLSSRGERVRPAMKTAA